MTARIGWAFYYQREALADLRHFYGLRNPSISDLLDLVEWLPYYDGAVAGRIAIEAAAEQAERRKVAAAPPANADGLATIGIEVTKVGSP